MKLFELLRVCKHTGPIAILNYKPTGSYITDCYYFGELENMQVYDLLDLANKEVDNCYAVATTVKLLDSAKGQPCSASNHELQALDLSAVNEARLEPTLMIEVH